MPRTTLAAWRSMPLLLLICALLAAVAPTAWAQDGPAKAESAKSTKSTAAAPADAAAKSAPLPVYTPPTVGRYGPSGTWMAIRTFFALGLVVGLVYLTAWVAKVRGGLTATPTGFRLRVVETIALGPSRNLHLVAVGKQILLLGAGSDGLRTLATFSAEELDYNPDAEAPPAESFLAKLQAFRGGGGDELGR